MRKILLFNKFVWKSILSLPGNVFTPVCGFVHSGVPVLGGLCPGGSLSRGISVQEGLCQGKSQSRGSLSRVSLSGRPPVQ